MAEVTFTLDPKFTQGLGFTEPFSFQVEDKVKRPDGSIADIKTSAFPRTPEENAMLLREIFNQGQRMQQNTGVFPDAAMDFLAQHSAGSQGGNFRSEVQNVLETTQRMQDDPIGMNLALKKYQAQQEDYKTPFMQRQEQFFEGAPTGLKTITAGAALVPNLAYSVAVEPWVAGDPDSNLPQSADDIIEDAIIFAKRRLPTDLQTQGRLGTIIAADLGLLLALRKAKIPESQIPTHKNFLMSKVMEGLNKVRTGAGVSATVGGVSGAASLGFDLTYNWFNRMYRDAYPIKFRVDEDGNPILDEKGEKIPEQPPITEDMLAALNQAKFEALFSGGAAAGIQAGGFLWRNFLSKSTGISSKDLTQKELAKLAAQYNIPLSIAAATDSQLVKDYFNVIGVFPFLGGPGRTSQDAAKQALYRELENVFTTLSPFRTVTETIPNLSEEAYKSFKQNFENFDGMKAVLYSAYDDIADEITEPFIPTTRIRQYFGNIAVRDPANIAASNTDYNLRYFNNLNELLQDVSGGPVGENKVRLLTQLANMPEYLTANEFRQFQVDINDAIKRLNPNTGGVTQSANDSISKMLTTGSKLIRQDMDDMNNWKQMSGDNQIKAEIAKERLNYANNFFFANKDDFASYFKGIEGTTRVGKLMETRVNQRFFQPGSPAAPGEFQIDQLFDFIMDTNVIQTSLRAQDQLYRQMGPEAFAALTRGWMDKQVGKHIKTYKVPVRQVQGGKLDEATGEPIQSLELRPVPGTGVSAFVPILDVEGLRRSFGLVKDVPSLGGIEARSTAQAMEHMFSLLGPEGKNAYKKLNDLLTLAERVQSFDVSDVSRFVQRRGVLGGARAAAGAFTAGMGVSNPLGALGTILVGRGITQYLTSPKAYQNIMKGLDDSLSPAVRRNALLEVVRIIDGEIGFDASEGEVRPSPITVEAGKTLLIREEPGSEKARKKAKKQVLGIEEFYGKKLDALSIPEVIDYFVQKPSSTSQYATTVELGVDPSSGEVVPIRTTTGDSSNPFDNQMVKLASMNPAEKFAKDILGDEQGAQVAQFAKDKAATEGVIPTQEAVGTGTINVPVTGQSKRNFPTGFRQVPQNLGPNPFLTGLSRFYQTNVAPGLNNPMSTGNILQGIINTPGQVNQFFRGVDQRFGLGPNNRLTKEQQIAMAEGNLNRAIAARRFNKGGIASTKK